MSRTNEVTLFSNGIGHFRRSYSVKGKTNISIPFKRDHIGDVAASLQVFGKVRLDAPPSFTPTNANATALHVASDDAYNSLITGLSGAKVRLVPHFGDSVEGTLLGRHNEESVGPDGQSVYTPYVTVLSEGRVKRVAVATLKDLIFTEDSVQTEIEKALKNNFQRIKPDSTLLDLTVSALSGEDTDAQVQYTIPVAAWKMRYSIRQEKGQFVLEGAAIIDNNTDEDWDNFRLSVVTGNPISFNTDIATVVTPNRKMVRLVDTSVIGNVSLQEGYSEYESASFGVAAAAAPRGGKQLSGGMPRSAGFSKCSVSNRAQYGLESAESLMQMASGDGNLDDYYQDVAESAGVDSKEVGDFSIFTSKEPITILARKSAVVPMFTVPLKTAGLVLLYKESNNSHRPFRTVKFKNESDYSLGKGKTVIYNEGVFSGECVLETTKPGENRMLPHCLENGVKVAKEQNMIQTKRSSLKLSAGVVVYEDVSTARTVYTLENKKDEAFKFALEHTNTLGSNNVTVDTEGVNVKDRERLPNVGYRYYFELEPKSTVSFAVHETLVNNSSVNLSANTYSWFKSAVVDAKYPISTDPQVLACVEVQRQIDAVRAEIQQTQTRQSELTQQAARVRENLNAAKDTGNAVVVAWVKDLDDTEKEIRTVSKVTLPGLVAKQTELLNRLTTEMQKISVVWKS